MAEEKVARKGPGRPPKNPAKQKLEIRGVVKQPNSTHSSMEFVNKNTGALGSALKTFKSISVSNIQFVIRPTEIIIYNSTSQKLSEPLKNGAKEHQKRIYLRIDCTKTMMYYAREPTEFGVMFDDFYGVIDKIDNKYRSVAFNLSDIDNGKALIVILDHINGVLESHKITVAGLYPKLDQKIESEILDDNMKLQFTLSFGYLRSIITKLASKSADRKFTVTQQSKSSDAYIDHINSNKKVLSKYHLRNKEQLNFSSKLADNESFSMDVYVRNIINVVNAFGKNNVCMKLDETKGIILISPFDDIITCYFTMNSG